MPQVPRQSSRVGEVATDFKVYNLYPQFAAPNAAMANPWPRGFPLDLIKVSWSLVCGSTQF